MNKGLLGLPGLHVEEFVPVKYSLAWNGADTALPNIRVPHDRKFLCTEVSFDSSVGGQGFLSLNAPASSGTTDRVFFFGTAAGAWSRTVTNTMLVFNHSEAIFPGDSAGAGNFSAVLKGYLVEDPLNIYRRFFAGYWQGDADPGTIYTVSAGRVVLVEHMAVAQNGGTMRLIDMKVDGEGMSANSGTTAVWQMQDGFYLAHRGKTISILTAGNSASDDFWGWLCGMEYDYPY